MDRTFVDSTDESILNVLQTIDQLKFTCREVRESYNSLIWNESTRWLYECSSCGVERSANAAQISDMEETGFCEG